MGMQEIILQRSLFVHLMHRVGGVASLELLHAPLYGVAGILPVGILVLIVKLLHHPGYILIQAFHVAFHQGQHHIVKLLQLFVGQPLVCRTAQIPEMAQTEAFAVFYLFPEIFIPAVHVEESIHIAGVIVPEMIADIAGIILAGNPHADAVAAGVALQLVLQGDSARREGSELLLHLLDRLLIMGLQDPGVAQSVAVVKHFLEMHTAEAGFVRGLADVRLHIGAAVSQTEVHHILLHGPFDIAEGTFVMGVHGIVKGYGIELFFHKHVPSFQNTESPVNCETPFPSLGGGVSQFTMQSLFTTV